MSFAPTMPGCLRLSNEPAFRDGQFLPLNSFNLHNPKFGRCDGETVSGHWLYAFLRYDRSTNQRFLVVANFHRQQVMEDVQVQVPQSVLNFLDVRPGCSWHLNERLSGASIEIETKPESERIGLGTIPPLTAYYFQLTMPG